MIQNLLNNVFRNLFICFNFVCNYLGGGGLIRRQGLDSCLVMCGDYHVREGPHPTIGVGSQPFLSRVYVMMTVLGPKKLLFSTGSPNYILSQNLFRC